MKKGDITFGYGVHEAVIATGFTPAAVDIWWEPEGYQCCGGAQPEVWPPKIIPDGFQLTCHVFTNSLRIHWTAWAEGERIQEQERVTDQYWLDFRKQYMAQRYSDSTPGMHDTWRV